MNRLTRIWLATIALCGPLFAQGPSPGPFPNSPAATSTPYTFTFSPFGGTSPYTYSVTSGILPAGLTLTSAVVLSGTPAVPGSYPLTFTVTDSTPATATVSGTLTILQSTTTVLTSSLTSPSAFGKQITLTATVTPPSTGSVTFYNGSAVLGTRTLSSGTATLVTSLLPTGPNQLKAFYKGNSTTAASKSSTLTQTVKSGGQNGFQPATIFGAGAGASQTFAVVTADFNGDGIPDLAANYGTSPGTVGVLLGNGNGTFGSLVTYPVGTSPRALAVGDFNGDGKADLVVTNFSSGGVSVLLGNGNGTFQTQVTYGIGASNPNAVVIGDFNGDGNADLAVTSVSANSVSILLGVGDGTFGTATLLTADITPEAIVAGDFNGDGITDLATSNYGSADISVFLGTGGGTFAGQVTYSLGAGATNPFMIAVDDFNGDGKLDLVTADYGTDNISVFLGTGSGTFGAASVIAIGSNARPYAIATGDFNGDGKVDIATANNIAGNVSVLLGNGSGGFAAPVIYNTGAATSGPTWLTVGDFNGDGVSDIVVANQSTSNLSLLPGAPSYFNNQPVTLTWAYPNLSTALGGPQTVTAGSGLEFSGFFSGNPAFNVDFGDTTIEIDSAVTTPPANNFDINVAFNGLVITNPGTGIIPNFTGVRLATSSWLDGNGNPFTRSRITFDSTHIYVDFRGMVNLVGDKVILQINPPLAASTTTLITAPNPSAFGQAVTLTATVTAGATGTVSFFQNSVGASNLRGSATLSGGTASLQTSNLPLGVTSIVAFYNGDTNWDVSTSNTVSQTVKNTTTNVLTSSANPTTPGTNVTFTATITPSSATGTVSFTDNGNSIGSGTLNASGIATLSTSSIIAGSHSIVATYLGDGNDFVSVSNTVTQVIKTTTYTSLSLSSNPSVEASQVTLTATVTPNTGSIVPTGTVTFYDATTILTGSPVSLNAGGVAVLNTFELTAGMHSLTAVYSGDPNNVTSTSSPVNQNVQSPSNTKLSSSPNPSALGQTVKLTAQVPAGGTGTVIFKDGATQIGGPVSPDSDGFARFQTSSLTDGVHTLFAEFSGDSQTAPSSDSLQQTVLPATTTTLSSVTPATAYFGQAVTLTATVSPSDSTGKVVFYDGATMLGSAVISGGTASISTPLLPSGVRSLRAFYTGSPTLGPGTSPAVSKTIYTRAQIGFGPPVLYTTGPDTVTSVLGDFNGDGKQDLAVMDFDSVTSTGVISILIGKGDGTFQPAIQYSNVGNFTQDLAVGDFNGDGIQDLVVADDIHGIVILTGNGDGTFTIGSEILVGDSLPVDSIAVGDFNNDGIADLIYGNGFAVSLLQGVGDGTFLAPPQVPATSGATQVKVADMNGDGIADLVSLDGSLIINIQLGFGDGTFGNPTQYASSEIGSDFSLGDFTGDNIPDVVLSTSGTSVILLPGIGDGTLGEAITIEVGGFPTYVAAGDFNGDGKQDILVGDRFTGTFSVVPGLGNGTFGPVTTTSTLLSPSGLVVGNFSGGTGRADIAVPNGIADNLDVMLGLPPGVSVSCPVTAPAVTGVAYNLACSASGGIPSYTWVQSSGTLPPGLSLDSSTGIISGTPTTTGSFNFSIQATDSDVPAQNGTVSVTLNVATPLVLASATLPNGTLNVAYSTPLASGGTPPYTCGLSPGIYPAGLDTKGSPCVLSGTPTSLGANSFTVGVSDSGSPQQNASRTFSLTIQSGVSTTVLTSSVNPSATGQNTILTATVTPSSATGTVTFKDNAATLGTGTLIGGTATFSIPSLSVGSHSLTAVYGGDANDLASTSSNLNQTVNQAPTTTTLTSSLNPSTFGTSVTLTATLAPSTATGNVTFKDGATTLGTGTLSGGTATFNTGTLSVASHSLTAVYAGDTNDATSTSSTLAQTVSQAPTATTLTSSLNPSAFGASITLTATLAPLTATGTVTFKDGATILGTATLSGGTATLNISTLSVAAHSLSASYGGDTNDATSTSSTLTQTVNQAPTITSLGAGGVPNPSIFGQTVTFTASVSPSTATGAVTFKDGPATLGTGNLSAGVASFQGSSLTAGTHSITAVYGGDANDAGSTSGASTQTVAELTALSLSTAPANPTTLGQSVVITATVNPSTAAGKVTFYDGAAVLGTGQISDGIAVLSTALLPSGLNSLSAYYAGSTASASSSSAILQQTVAALPGNGFQPAVHYIAGAAPFSQTLGDFNGDGNADLVVVNFGADSVSVLLGNGDGTFRNAVDYAVGSAPTTVAAGDINGDGKTDLAVTNSNGNTVSVLYGNGDGTFQPAGALSVGSAPVYVAVGDFNADGIADLSVANSVDNTVSVLLGSGNGVFRLPVNYTVGVNPRAIAVGDFNGDGKADLAVPSATDRILRVLLGNGDGSFQAAVPYGVGLNASAVTTADLNGDGVLDLAVANSSDNTVSVLLGNGNGTFAAQVTYTVAPSPTSVAVGDFNGDGIPDLAVSHSSGPLYVLFGNGNGTFQTPVSYPAGLQGLSAVVADFNRDGRADIAIANNGSNNVSVLLAAIPTTTTLTSSANPSTPGQGVTFTATVSPSTATGSITFKEGTTTLGTGTLSGGTAALNISTLPVGLHSLTVSYGGDTGDAISASSALVQIVNQAATTTTLTSSANPSTSGQSVTFTATVSPPTATGTVAFKDGATTLGIVTLSGAAASLNISTLSVAAHSLTALYSGDVNDVAGVSSSLTQTVNQAPTTTTLTSSPNLSTFGASITLTATLAPSTATGTVTFKDGTTILSTASLSGGTATLNISTLSVGSHSLTAVYGGDTNDIASTSSTLAQTINQAPTTTTLTSSPNPSTFGASVTLAATLSPPTASGTVTFKDGTTTLGTGTLSGGITTLNISTLAVGPHSLTAVYGGDTNDVASTSSTLAQTVNQAPTATTLTSSLNPSTFGTSVTLTATLSPSTATGSVTFKDGLTTLGTGTLSGGTATFNISTLSVASHSLTAVYAGDTNDAGSISSTLAQTVNQAPTATTLTSSLNPSTFGTSVTLTATLSPSTATGSVTFKDGLTTLGTGTLSGGTATFNISTLSVATHSLTAVYAGDTNDAGSTSSTLAQTVNQAPTATTLTSSLNPSTFGTSVTLTATLSPSTATGSVTFKDGLTTLGTGTLSGGTATFNISTLSVASHSLTAVYAGDTNDAGSISSTLAQTVNQAPTATTLTSSLNPSTLGTSVTLTATLSPSTATGSVTFKDGAATLGTGTLASGVATLNTSTLSAGTHLLTASYAGDINDAPSQSSVLNQTVIYPPLSITTSSLPSGQATVNYGPFTLQANGGSGTYSWSAGGLPSGITLSTDGTLSGISSVAFNGTVSISVTDTTSGQAASASLALTLTSGPLVISGSANLGSVAVGAPISASFSAQGGTPPYIWTLSGAPAGFTVDATGKVTGIPAQAGNAAFSLQVKDSTPTTPATASMGLTLSAFGITATSLPPASTLADYSATINAAGGAPPYTFSASGLPAGLNLTGATISGRANAPGTYNIAVKASDSKGLSASASLSLSVTGPGPLQITSGSLPDGTINQPYSQTLSAQGGSPAYTWSQSGGVLPPGLSLNSSGTIFGAPTQPGSYSLGVQVNDTSGGQAVGAISINIQPAPLQITSGAKLPSGIASAVYPTQGLSATGGVAPYTFTQKGSLPDGLTLTNGQIAGTPGTPGDFSFTLNVADSSSPPVTGTLAMSVTIRPNSADLVLSAGSATFALTSGTSSVPSANTITVSSSVATQVLDFTVDSSSAPWLAVSGGTSTPATLAVGLSNAALALSAAGSPYSGVVVLTCTSGTCAGRTQSIGVALTVTAPPPQLSLSAAIFSFVASTSNPQSASAALGIQNSGGGKLDITSVTAADSWITVGSFPASVSPGPGAAVTITANPGSLKAGYYTSSVTVTTSAGNAAIPVTLLISAESTMILGPDGAQFSMPQGGTLGNSNGSFLVSVSSTSGVTFSASVLPGASWLLGGSSGAATSTNPGTVNFSLDPVAIAALPVGAYYGTIRVSGSGIVNTPLDFQVVLSISPASTPVVPDLQPGGLLFLSASPGPLAPQAIQVFASSKTPLPFQVSATTNDGSAWLTISAQNGSALAGSPAQILASVDSTGLKPGVYSGSINFASGPAVRTANVTLVVETPLSATPASLLPAVSGLKPADSGPVCANAKLVPAPTGLVSNFAAPASWPTPITLKLVDTCGSIIGKGQIVATFSNGDPPLALSPVNVSTGLYSGTWTPRKNSSQTIITAQATAPGYLPASVQVQGQVTPNAAPQLVPNGTLDIFNPQVGGGLGPGNIVQIYGTSLASQPVSATTLPLPTKVAGTQVLIGGITAPLFYVSPTQVNAQIPFELHAGQQYQVIVSANGALTTPQPIQLNAGAPALLQFTSGLVIAQHPDGSLISDAAPAVPGEFIVLYMTGLGATDIQVPTGQPSPSDPPANVLDVPSVSLNGNPIKLLFAGLTPGLVGLYQINIRIPADLADHTYDLEVSQGGVVSNTTSLPVKTPAPAQ